MADPKVAIVPVDPLHPVVGLLFPSVSQRILSFTADNMIEVGSDQFTRTLLARAVVGDPDFSILAMVNPAGHVVGHVLSAIERIGERAWVYVFQCQADANVGGATREAMRWLDAWGKTRGATAMRMSTGRSEKGWERAYGFKPMRHLMWREFDMEKDVTSPG